MAYDFEKERNEAIAAGERALTSLRAAREELRSAGNWGLVDLFGGGMISGLSSTGLYEMMKNLLGKDGKKSV